MVQSADLRKCGGESCKCKGLCKLNNVYR